MAGETVLRQWWLVVRRGGVIVQRIQVRINPDKRNPEIDPFVGPISRDFEVIDIGTDIDLTDVDQSVMATFELVAVNNVWEIQYLD